MARSRCSSAFDAKLLRKAGPRSTLQQKAAILHAKVGSAGLPRSSKRGPREAQNGQKQVQFSVQSGVAAESQSKKHPCSQKQRICLPRCPQQASRGAPREAREKPSLARSRCSLAFDATCCKTQVQEGSQKHEMSENVRKAPESPNVVLSPLQNLFI